MQPYIPNTHVSFGGLITGVLVALLGSLILGIIAAAAAAVVTLIPWSMILFAVGGLGVAHWAMVAGRLRSPAVGVLLGLLIGVSAWLTYRTGNYVVAIIQVMQEQGIGSTSSTMPDKNGDSVESATGLNAILAQFNDTREDIDEDLEDEVGQGGPFGFWNFQVAQGMQIESSRYGSSSSPIDLGPDLTRGYDVLELVLLVGISIFGGLKRARLPFHETENRWLNPKDYRLVGTFNTKQYNPIVKALNNGDQMPLRQAMQTGTPDDLGWAQSADFGDPRGRKLVRISQRNARRKQEARAKLFVHTPQSA